MLSSYVTDWGEWGNFELCDTASNGFALKVQDYNVYDDTALNGLKLFCTNSSSYVTCNYLLLIFYIILKINLIALFILAKVGYDGGEWKKFTVLSCIKLFDWISYACTTRSRLFYR